MEMQEAVLRNLFMIIGWSATPRYADLRGSLTEELLSLAGPEAEWHWDGAQTLITEEKSGFNLALSPTEVLIAIEPADQELGDLPNRIASLILERLPIKSALLIGAGSVWLSPVSDVGELNEWLAGEMGNIGKPGLYDAFGGRPSKFHLKAEIEDEKFVFDVDLRPITAADAAESDDFLSDEEDDFPPAALYLEVKRTERDEIDAELAAEKFADNLERSLAAAKKFDTAIRQGL